MASYEQLKRIAQEAIEHLDDLNTQYPNLASETSVEAVEKWRKNIIEYEPLKSKSHTHTSTLEVTEKEKINHHDPLEIITPGTSTQQTTDNLSNTAIDNSNPLADTNAVLKERALELFEKYDFEDVLDKMADQYGCNLNAHQLVDLVGPSAYYEALKREIKVFSSNAITNDQAANLWNSLGRPSLYGGAWDGSDISKLAG